MGMMTDIKEAAQGYVAEVKDAIAEAGTGTVITAQSKPAKVKKETMRQLRLKHGLGVLNPRGNYLSKHDVHMLEIMGCDLTVLGDLVLGEMPAHAPNQPGVEHPLQTATNKAAIRLKLAMDAAVPVDVEPETETETELEPANKE